MPSLKASTTAVAVVGGGAAARRGLALLLGGGGHGGRGGGELKGAPDLPGFERPQVLLRLLEPAERSLGAWRWPRFWGWRWDGFCISARRPGARQSRDPLGTGTFLTATLPPWLSTGMGFGFLIGSHGR